MNCKVKVCFDDNTMNTVNYIHGQNNQKLILEGILIKIILINIPVYFT
jgi:hypothetical protein